MKKILLLMVIVSIALAGCDQADDTGGAITNPFQGGSQGVAASFEIMGVTVDGMEEAFGDEEFPIEVNIRNKGEHPIQANELAVILRGVDPNTFTGLVAKTGEELIINNVNEIEAVEEFNPEGGEDTLSFAASTDTDPTYSAEITGSQYILDFFADVIYDYQTDVIVPKACFKEDVRDPSICDVEGSKEVFSSGAPVQVTSVNQAPAGAGKIALEFTVSNMGSGRVQAPDEQFDPSRDFVSFEITTNPEDWDCKAPGPAGQARLETGSAVIRCKSNELEAGTLFTRAVNMKLSYQYKETISKTLRMKSVDS